MSDPVMPDLTTPAKRIVIEYGDGTMQIVGLASQQPAAMLPMEVTEMNPHGAICLVRAEHRFYVYKPLMLAQTSDEHKPFHKDQR